MDSNSTTIFILEKSSRISKYFDSPGYHTPGSQFFETKIRITQQKLNQNRKYFNPLVSGPGRFEILKKKLEVENLVGLSL